MATLTSSGRAGLAAALAAQPLYWAWGLGNPVWETDRDHTGTFGADGKLKLPYEYVSAVSVSSVDGTTHFSLVDAHGVGDFTFDHKQGVVTRTSNGEIPAESQVKVSFHIDTPPEDFNATGLLSLIGFRTVNEVHFVNPDPAGGIVVPSGRYTISPDPTRHLLFRIAYDFEDAPASIIREVALYSGTVTDPALPVGQRYFNAGEVVSDGTLIALENRKPIPRSGATRETFEQVISL